MRRIRSAKTMGVWLTETRWMRLLSESVRERVLAEAYEELHAEKAFVARKGEPARSWIGVVEGLLNASARVSADGLRLVATMPSRRFLPLRTRAFLEFFLQHVQKVAAMAGAVQSLPALSVA